MIQEPVQPIPTETPPARPSGGGRPSKGLIGLVIVACLALAVPVVAVIATSSSSAPASAVGAPNDPGSAAEPGTGKGNGNGPKGNNGNGPKGDKGPKGNNGHGPKGPISITAVNGSNVSLATEDGWTRTIAVTGTTVITKGGQTIGVADLKVGDVIRFHQVRNADGKFTIDAINVPTPRAGGEVTAVDATSITVKKGGSTRVIAVNGSTVYTVGEAAGSKADVKVGTDIEAQGTVSGDTFTATAVHVQLPRLGGTVTGKTADTITVTTVGGTTATIHVSSGTTYRIKGNAAAGLADVAVGDRVSAAGTLRPDGSLDAIVVGAGNGKGIDKNGNGDNDDSDDDDTPAPATSAAPG